VSRHSSKRRTYRGKTDTGHNNEKNPSEVENRDKYFYNSNDDGSSDLYIRSTKWTLTYFDKLLIRKEGNQFRLYLRNTTAATEQLIATEDSLDEFRNLISLYRPPNWMDRDKMDVVWVYVEKQKCVIHLCYALSVKFEDNTLSTNDTHVFLGSHLIAVCTTPEYASNLEKNLNHTYMDRNYRRRREEIPNFAEQVHATSTQENQQREQKLRTWIRRLLRDSTHLKTSKLREVHTYVNANTGKTIREYMSLLKDYGLRMRDFGGWTIEKVNLYKTLSPSDEERIENNDGAVITIDEIKQWINDKIKEEQLSA